MKYFLLLFFVGFASAAAIYDEDESSRDLSVVSSYMDVLDLDDLQFADEGGDGEQSELEKVVRKKFEEILQKIKDGIDKGQHVKEELLEKAKELKEKLKELKAKISEKAKELIKGIRNKIRDYFQKLLDKIDTKDKRAVGDAVENLKDMFRKLRKTLLEKLTKEGLTEVVEKIFGKGSELAERIINFLKEKGDKGKQKLLDFIDRVLVDKEDREERSVGEIWQKVKDYFEKVNLEIKEKFMKFGEWVKGHMGNLLEHGKTKIDKLKEIAKQLKDHTKEISKEIAAEGLEFFRPYKDDLGALWVQLKDALGEILKRKD